MNKWVEHNKKEYGVQIVELKKIIERQVLDSGSSDEFTSDMYVALISGRKITEKMSAAIDRLIKANSPEEIFKRDEKTLGELFTFFILEVILLGNVLKLNPYNQPAVEAIKKETKKILS